MSGTRPAGDNPTVAGMSHVAPWEAVWAVLRGLGLSPPHAFSCEPALAGWTSWAGWLDLLGWRARPAGLVAGPARLAGWTSWAGWLDQLDWLAEPAGLAVCVSWVGWLDQLV